MDKKKKPVPTNPVAAAPPATIVPVPAHLGENISEVWLVKLVDDGKVGVVMAFNYVEARDVANHFGKLINPRRVEIVGPYALKPVE